MLTAAEADGLTVDGQSFGGEVRLAADPGPASAARVAYGERRLVVLVREGAWGVRDFDPESSARRAFGGLRVTPYDQRWAVPGRFTPYGTGRTVRVANADGRERGLGLGLGGELAFALEGRELSLQVSLQDDGSLWAVFADATSGRGSYRFRFLRPAAPDADGLTTVDFNRALLHAVRLRRSLRPSLPATGEHAGRRGGGGGAHAFVTVGRGYGSRPGAAS